MMDDGKNDYDRIAEEIDHVLATFVGNAFEPFRDGTVSMSTEGFVTGVIKGQRLRDWVEGLAESHHKSDV